MVEATSDKFIVVVDDMKLVDSLGAAVSPCNGGDSVLLEVSNIYIRTKKDEGGELFGFVRFARVANKHGAWVSKTHVAGGKSYAKVVAEESKVVYPPLLAFLGLPSFRKPIFCLEPRKRVKMDDIMMDGTQSTQANENRLKEVSSDDERELIERNIEVREASSNKGPYVCIGFMSFDKDPTKLKNKQGGSVLRPNVTHDSYGPYCNPWDFREGLDKEILFATSDSFSGNTITNSNIHDCNLLLKKDIEPDQMTSKSMEMSKQLRVVIQNNE
ncbi:unnamed protein product [Sphenostylis stenocarpa]|uniref:Uncharacterized protein n=1 Tax=Sphenostylis stenocarpa TaxID=92480 RepID=A0AA86TDS5_9FABA|nr:unnamed protein product [Sphenostylis stenocarpa]